MSTYTRLVWLRDLEERLGVDRNTIDRWRREGNFPPALRICGRPCWRAETIEAWIASLPSDAGPIAVAQPEAARG